MLFKINEVKIIITNKSIVRDLSLDGVITQNANRIPKKYQETKYINQLAIKCQLENKNTDFVQLAIVLYRKCFIGRKINNTLKGSHIPFCSKEDFFGLFYLTIYKCVQNYNLNEGDFQNYFVKMYSLALANEKKQSFLKITGKTSDVVNKKGFPTNVSTSDIDISQNFEFDTEKNIMNETMIKKLKSIPDGDILIYKYLTDNNKPRTNKEVADKFHLTEKQIRLRLTKVSNIFKENNPTYLQDYFYDEKDTNDLSSVNTSESLNVA